MVSRTGGKALRSSFNEGISVPEAAWKQEVARDPALASRDKGERYQALKRSIERGELAKYRGR
jgi:hypothetical protein